MINFSAADLTYIRGNYFTLEELCAGREETPVVVRKLIRDRVLPAPPYVLEDGAEMLPADCFVLVDQAGGAKRLRGHFELRHRVAGGDPAELEEDWDAYLNGVYSVCLRQTSPEAMVRKSELVASLTELLDDPRPENGDWRMRLRREAWELDELERQFSPDYDRSERFGESPSRDRLVAAARDRHADVFASEVRIG